MYIKNCKPTLIDSRKKTIKHLNADKALDELEAKVASLEAAVFGQKFAQARLYV